MFLFIGIKSVAQITIGGNVYGGGNAGDLGGKTNVSIYAGDLHQVYGGARQADVAGSTFVHIDGEHASSYIVIDKVYGGNDISGTIGSSTHIPTELTQATENHIDHTWNTFVRISTKTETTGEGANAVTTETDDAQKIYIGQLFGGGNGDYNYSEKKANDKYDVTIGGTTIEDIVKPESERTYLEILGGSIVYAYGGGNNVTVAEKTVICVDNPSKVVNSIKDTRITTENEGELLTDDRLRYDMGINMGFSFPTSDAFQIGRFFGGNNKAEMAIRPTWNLKTGKIRNLYSGGNQGAMTSPEGLLLEIPATSKIIVDNLYGGCRMADVCPKVNGVNTPVTNIPGYYFPDELSARVLVRGGDVNNVYGGNDITGRVYGGSAVGIYTRVRGDVYGGGNGSYPYTDNPALIGDDIYGDLYYTVPSGKTSAEALNDFRPNAEQVSIHLYGTDAEHPTIIEGGVYCGGNCATLKAEKLKPMVELKIGSYVYADKVFLGNNGENMIKYNEGEGAQEGVLRTLRRTDKTGDGTRFNSMDLTQKNQFEAYMDGVAMSLMPRVVFDAIANGDPANYEPYTSYFGSVFCGGNVGSMTSSGKTTIEFKDKIIIYNKVVGGCNNAVVEPSEYNAVYVGGLLNDADEDGNKLELNFNGTLLEPKRWNADKTALIWNTVSASTGLPVDFDPATASIGLSTEDDMDRRLDGGNVYGGCYNSGIVNGNVIININGDMVNRSNVFDVVTEDDDAHYEFDEYHITQRKSGVILYQQGMDVLGTAMNVFGGGYGENTEIWGSATINMNRGYIFQVFGGSEKGAIGKKDTEGKYTYDEKYSTYVNLQGPIAGVGKQDNMTEDMAECEFLYGGGFIGPVAGNCIVNLGNGRVYESFGGSCNADVLGHTETYIGNNGFPYIRDYVYGGNDLGGKILGEANFNSRLRSEEVRSKVYNTDMLNAAAYIEFVQGHAKKIFGGAFGVYEYNDPHYREYFDENGHAKTGYSKPYLGNAFINFRPNASNNPLNTVEQIYGAGQGIMGEEEENKYQASSYIIIDIPQTMQTFQNTEVFGGGECGGVGMYVDKAVADAPATAHKASAIIDLMSGHIKAVYGGSFQEGITRRSVINVPAGSTIRATSLFGGAYGLIEKDNEGHDVPRNDVACDVYEAIVNYSSADATIDNAIYGGNNNCRRTLYGTVNINTPVWSNKEKGYTATVYGAGYGVNTWSQYTEVNLNNGATVYEAYGGGQNGRVINVESVAKWKETHTTLYTDLEDGYTDDGLENALARSNKLHEVDATYPEKFNTNVHIKEGATVVGYCYGGGLGDSKIAHSGNVYGTTYIDLLGGTVKKDLYAAGTTGSVKDSLGVKNGFIASSTAYIEGGTARNVYGGGWKGSVGHHQGSISDPTTDDILGETHVIIGKLDGTSFIDGIPAVERNAYGGGEGGAVFGTTNITLLKGFIGYRHFDAVPTTDTDLDYIQEGSDYYQEKLHDETWTGDGTNRLYDSGCIFGGGYIDNSSVDNTKVKMYGGNVRNALFGGGEIAAIGRGVIHASGQDNSVRTLQGIYKAGHTNIEMFGGHVYRNVFGGGRGYNNLGEGGTLYSDGYVFGQTEVHVHGGEVGSDKGMALGYGNVFGGGDIGYVYSAYEDEGKLYVGIKDGNRYDDKYEGYYYAYNLEKDLAPENYIPYIPADFVYHENDPKWVMDNGEYVLTEDCKVLIEPHAKAISAVTINGHNYNAGDYIPTTDMSTMGNKNLDSRWDSLDDFGIIIHNAVFAGGNTSSGSSAVYANATTVFGNATASVHDVYHRDLITLGTGHTGGLYGDGNLTFVDGYRGLNITNYGTDYYSIAKEITITQYHDLPDREAAYYELRYKCIQECTDKDGTTYHPASGNSKASTLTADDILTLFKGVEDNGTPLLVVNAQGETVPNSSYWQENGVLPVYAGRLMNTIQRADFCGVFGSRMVMQGAQDRVPEVVDLTNYTINRVREVSLNQQHSKIDDDLALKPGRTETSVEDQNPDDYLDLEKAIHGNYFGIYNIVNYLGALTSDVHFRKDVDIRRTDNTDEATYKCATNAYTNGSESRASKAYGAASYYDWKASFFNERKRNNGTSLHKVALASGVYLELTSEKSTGTGINEKDWGYITGVIELDLINVQAGIGGGFVYAKNEHRIGTYTEHKHNTLTKLNEGAITRKDYTYSGEPVEWETSGNFVHSTQTIVDDCYNISGKYKGDDAVPAHYWFIKGSVYVYDQYISAYTGVPNAYSESVDIPLAITAASHGTMKLLDVKPNRYAYYASPEVPLAADQKMIINDVTYYKNDPISYWDWYLLSKSEQELFVEETYVTIAACKYSSTAADTIPAGSVYLPKDYAEMKAAHPTVYHVEKKQDVPFEYVFRSSNNVGHDTGYMLTYKVSNPTDWNTWYTKFESDTQQKQQTEFADACNNGPTYHLIGNTGGVLGQQSYTVSNIISKDVYDTYQNMVTNHSSELPDGQATFTPAYIVTKEYEDANRRLHVGSTVSEADAASLTGYVAPAYICTSTIQIDKTEYIYLNSKMTLEEKNAYIARFATTNPQLAADINASIVPAYYCTVDGLYGGDYYEAGKNYRGLAAWSSLSKTDREKFAFNYDALDLLIDPSYSKNANHPEGKKYQYDSEEGTLAAAEANLAGYSLEKPVEYTATYNGSEPMTYGGVTITNGTEITRTIFEQIPNEKHHYAPIKVTAAGDVYVVKTTFQIGNSPYAAGSTISTSTYNSLGTTDQQNITKLTFTSGDVGKTYYFCREEYTIGEHDEGVGVTGLAIEGTTVSGAYTNGQNVPVGLVITSGNYGELTNKQLNFTIHGISPMEISTLYVSRQSDIFDLSSKKIITVIYEYAYEESDALGLHVTPISERHVLNIYLEFKSGIPSVEDIKEPQIVLPGTFVSMREPNVTPGAYEVTGGGWELFEKIGDAESHINGIEYTPNFDPLYWYQDGYYVAYYAKTYLGKTYSNHVPVSVANYHDLKKVMDDKEHHYYIDNSNVKRESKIYINDATDGATQLKQLFDLSLLNSSTVTTDENGIITTAGPFTGHALLDEHVKGCQNLEFFLHTNINHSGNWTPIGDNTNCFAGNMHGDGYHIDGLDHSLFGNLCGNVYNLGVTGSFTSAGVADTGMGYVENCWINTTGTPDTSVRAVFGNPTASQDYKIVNCYYPETLTYNTTDNGRGLARTLPVPAFHNGTATYNLNGFYLFKRYHDKKTTSGTNYKYYTINDDGTLSAPKTKYYRTAPTYCSSGVESVYFNGGYVEDRYADGDYRYADGSIPESVDERMYVANDDKSYFYPIWPDDYIYFGQMLTYGWNEARPHEEVPSHIVKSGSRLSNSDDGNRVFRAPAYYQSKTMGVAHFNPSVNLVAYTKPENELDTDLHPAYPNMTAIDFAGHNDTEYKLGYNGAWFYQPLLDDDGLLSIANRNETSNLLVYAPTAEANEKTYNVLTNYFTEPAYSDYYDESDPYRRVDEAPTWSVHGHLVHNDFTATNDHLLVDKKDFNCPMSYTFDGDYRMWYQRVPDHFVNLTKGWSTVSLPFTAELVSTQDKGEITHFYSGSRTMEENEAKIGHEYWLREYKGKKEESGSIFSATFNYPTATGNSKQVDNTFLWDYYYSKNTQKDANTDIYQTYYETGREMSAYPLLATATPYIIGFPGKTYYEFDLSGEWKPLNTAPTAPAQLDKQSISFVSVPGITIGVSDDELTATAVDGYTFMPNYMSKTVDGYLMNIEGNSFDITPAGGSATTPFRPYFIAGSPANAKPNENAARSIIFESNDTSFGFNDKDPSEGELGDGTILITTRKHTIKVTSTLPHETDVLIVNTGGLTTAAFTIQPGETIETPVKVSGIYIVRADGGKYHKKVAVK